MDLRLTAAITADLELNGNRPGTPPSGLPVKKNQRRSGTLGGHLQASELTVIDPGLLEGEHDHLKEEAPQNLESPPKRISPRFGEEDAPEPDPVLLESDGISGEDVLDPGHPGVRMLGKQAKNRLGLSGAGLTAELRQSTERYPRPTGRQKGKAEVFPSDASVDFPDQ